MVKKAIKTLFILIAVFIAGLVIFQISSNNPKAIVRSLSKIGSLAENKKFVFSVKLFGVIPAGEAVLLDEGLSKLDNRQVYSISAEAKPAAFITKFYKVKANITSFMDKESLLPVLLKQSLEIQNKPSDNKEVYYDQKKHIMTIKGQERAIMPETYEPLSAMRFLRSQDFNKLKSFDININTNQKNYGMKGEVLRKEKIILGNKEYFVWVLKANIARRDKNNPYHRSQVTFYLLDDAQKTPLLIKVFASGAYIVATLKRCE